MHIELTTIVVNDYDDAIHFVQHILGFDLVDDSPSLTNDGEAKRWVVYARLAPSLDFCSPRPTGRRASVVGRQVAGRVGFFLRVGDFDTAHTQMVAAGVEFISAPRDEPTDGSPSSATSAATDGTCSGHREPFPTRWKPSGRRGKKSCRTWRRGPWPLGNRTVKEVSGVAVRAPSGDSATNRMALSGRRLLGLAPAIGAS